MLLFSLFANAQQHRTCATHDLYLQEVQADPSILTRRAAMEQQIQRWISSNTVQRSQGGGQTIITIPVVVHVLWYNVNQDITTAQILSQIDVLNQDYGLMNPDTNLVPAAFKPLVGNVQFQFCMATTDPSGNPTNGIERRQTTVTRIGNGNRYYQTSQGGLNIWNPNSYLNFWICDIDGGSTLGYTYLPGTVNSAKDGVVIDWQYWGTIGTVTPPFNKGRTATHEVGHWFNLEHIWADEPNCSMDDYVSDTPQQKGENYGCPNYPQTTQSGGRCSTADPSAMFMNYMDYTDDACMFMFTPGQAARMQASLNFSRAGLFNSLGCNSPSGISPASPPVHCFVHPNPTSGEFEIDGIPSATQVSVNILDVSGRVIRSLDFGAGDRIRIDLSAESAGVYHVSLSAAEFHQFAKIIKY